MDGVDEEAISPLAIDLKKQRQSLAAEMIYSCLKTGRLKVEYLYL